MDHAQQYTDGLLQEEQYLKARAAKKFMRGCVVCDARPTWTTEEYEAHIAHGGRGLEASDSIFRQGWTPIGSKPLLSHSRHQ